MLTLAKIAGILLTTRYPMCELILSAATVSGATTVGLYVNSHLTR
ncbi:MAG: hypothetical protein RBJ76_13380 [Stenomitos frigidus ULC029]